ncbi:MAG: hypothetical protein WCT14_09535, partial [Treponemataceae bacterium]
ARKLFDAALRYDPANREATRYLSKVEDFRENSFAASFAKAQKLAVKNARSQDEEYAMNAALRRAVTLNPKDEDARKMLKETANARMALVKSYLEKSTAVQKPLTKDSTDAAKERVYIDAFTLVSRATDMEPNDFDANQAYNELRSNIQEIVKRRIVTLKKMYSDNAYSDARAQLSVLKDLNAKIGRTFKNELQDAEYDLYFSWASYSEKRKDWPQAEGRVAQALTLKKTTEANELAKRVSASRAEEERGAGFSAGLKNLDAMIAKGDLDGAQRVITYLTKIVSDPGQRKAIDARRQGIRSALEAVYERGVKAYKEERFKDAVSALKTVVNIDPSYEDAGDYLGKAQDKQKLVDQY